MLRKMLLAVAFRGLLATCGAAAGAGEEAAKVKLPPGVPEGAEAWLVLPAPKTSIGRVKGVAEGVVAGTGAAAEMFLNGLLVKQGGAALDGTKPLVAVFTLAEEPTYAVGVSLKLEGNGVEALEARFGKATKTEGGISTYLEVQEGALPDKEIYAAIKDGRLVLGDDPKLVKALLAAGAPAGGAYAKDLDALAGMDVKALTTRYKDKIEEFLKKLETNPAEAFGMVKQVGEGEAGEEEKKKLDAVKMVGATYAGLIRSGIKEVTVLEAEARVGEKEVSLAYGFQAAPGGELAGAIEKLAAAELPGTGHLPENALATVAASVHPEVMVKFLDLFKKVTDGLAAVVGATEGDEEAKALAKGLAEYMEHAAAAIKQMDGKFIETVSRRAGGICGVVLGGVKDPEAARTAGLKAIKAMQGGELGKLWAKTGIKWELKEKFRESGGLAVERMTIDFKLPANPNLPPEMQAQMQEQQKKLIKAMYGIPIIYELAYSKKGCFVAFGKEAPKALDEFIERVQGGEGGSQALAAAIKRAPEGSFMVAEISIMEYAKLIKDMLAQSPVGAMMPQLNLGDGPDKNPATAWATAAGGRLTLRYNVPLEPVKKIVAEFQKAQQQMMQQMQPVPAPAPVPPGPAEGF